MRHRERNSKAAEQISQYFKNATMPSQQETLGRIVTEILVSGKTLSRKAICTSLLSKLETVTSSDEENHYHQLIALLFGRDCD
ncbi:two-component-system connector protein YcgZ [Erwinia sp. S43]|uniref:Two-component-system connector protein YcgZ n=1 Tax=Pantoea coffeiphila TaxID=1465635 RepID=A0A2S9I732_9GAMM|nr:MULTISPECIES: regulatory protein YcgZ [Erwiniaceae]MBK0004259.1 two-component-system connector protein YcgZ [Erwinia sp. S38]MBK0035533.1 two-component-system connector protein YcgZ [Erwinia sp. S43]PRD13576.1 two-component-system connector protein YcgZ [Pantoea coffeiphila]